MIAKAVRQITGGIRFYRALCTSSAPGGFAVTVELDYRCNARCGFCARWSEPARDDVLTTDEVMTLIDAIADQGGQGVSLCGGEPLLRRDVFEISRHAKQQRLRVDLNTNGLLLERFAEDIVAAGIDYVSVSIDRVAAAAHDELRQTPGIHERALAGIKKLRELDEQFNVGIAAVVVSENLPELEALVELGHAAGVKVLFQPVHDDQLSNLFLSRPELGFDAIGSDEIRRRVAGVIERLRERFGPLGDVEEAYLRMIPSFLKRPEALLKVKCISAGRTRYIVSPYGDIYPCESRRDVCLGNVRQEGFTAAIDSEVARRFRRENLRRRPCVCWWRCQAIDTVAWQFAPLPRIGRLFRWLWERKRRRLEL